MRFFKDRGLLSTDLSFPSCAGNKSHGGRARRHSSPCPFSARFRTARARFCSARFRPLSPSAPLASAAHLPAAPGPYWRLLLWCRRQWSTIFARTRAPTPARWLDLMLPVRSLSVSSDSVSSRASVSACVSSLVSFTISPASASSCRMYVLVVSCYVCPAVPGVSCCPFHAGGCCRGPLVVSPPVVSDHCFELRIRLTSLFGLNTGTPN